MTALVFVRNARLLAAIVAVAMLALFFVKITGFVAGGLLCLFAFVAGRLPFAQALLAASAFLAALAGIEITTGFITAYIADIQILVGLNSGILLKRMLQSASLNFGVILPAAVLCIVLAVRDWRPLKARFLDAVRARPLSGRQAASFSRFADHSAFWLGTAILAGLFFESQNTGSQAMIFIWPLMLAILVDAARPATGRMSFFAVSVLAFAIALPPLVNTAERAGRAWVGAVVNNVPLEHDNLETLGLVSMRPVIDTRAERMREVYIEEHEKFETLVGKGEMPAFLIFSEFDFQIGWLRAVDEAITAIRAYEDENGVTFDTILAMDFTNPFPWLMDKSGVKHISIAADPYRTVPEPQADVVAAVAEADLALRPTCPVHHANTQLADLYEPLLTNHTAIELTPCYTAYVRNGL